MKKENKHKIKFVVPNITNKKQFKFVGFDNSGNNSVFVFPCDYQVDVNDFSECKAEAKKLIKIIKSIDFNTYNVGNNKSTFQYLSMLWLMHDYLENGYYVEKETTTKISNGGKIDWKRTIKNNNIWLDNGNIVYNEFFRKVVKLNDNNIITEIYKFCLDFSVENLGWLNDISKTEKSIFANTHEHINLMLYFLNEKLVSTFADYKRMLFKNLQSILLGLQSENQTNNYVLTDKEFEYVFENLVDSCFGTEDVKKYYNQYEYHMEENNEKINVSLLRPDTICINNSEMYILDAKYYGYGYTHSKYDLPQSSSIIKQISYEHYMNNLYGLNSNSENKFNIKSAFILPYASEEKLKYIGYAKSNVETDDKVYFFLVDLKELVHSATDKKTRYELQQKLFDYLSKKTD